MKAEEIQEMPMAELQRKLEESKQELFNLRFQIATRKIKNHQRIPQVKRDIARMLTAIRERELMAQYAGVELEETEPVAAGTSRKETPRRGLLGRLGRNK
jgi:large subunit ribosomal protein L29